MNPPVAQASVRLSFEPSVQLVSPLSVWVAQLCNLALEDEDVASRLRMAVHELVENTVRYSDGKHQIGVELDIERNPEGTQLRLSTSNRATPEQIERAVKHLVGVKTATDAVSYYDDLVRDSAPRPDVSGLGLARIRAEGELNVDFHVVGNELTIIVQTSLPNQPSAAP